MAVTLSAALLLMLLLELVGARPQSFKLLTTGCSNLERILEAYSYASHQLFLRLPPPYLQ